MQKTSQNRCNVNSVYHCLTEFESQDLTCNSTCQNVSVSCPCVHAPSWRLAITTKHLLESFSELVVEDGVENGVDCGVGVTEPKEEGVQLLRDPQPTSEQSLQQVRREEADPEAAEERDDDGHPDGGLRLAILASVLLTLALGGRRARTANNVQKAERSMTFVTLIIVF